MVKLKLNAKIDTRAHYEALAAASREIGLEKTALHYDSLKVADQK